MRLAVLAASVVLPAVPAMADEGAGRVGIDALIAQHARAHGVPEALVHRVIMRESRYNPRASSRGNFGLMQIRAATARGMGYQGPDSGLLDANTNLTYGVPYRANAYRVAGGNEARAMSLYTRGYYYEAKRKGLLGSLASGRSTVTPDVASPQPQAVADASLPEPSTPEIVDPRIDREYLSNR